MARSETVSVAQFPTRFLTAVVFLTGLLLAWLAWEAFQAYRVIKIASQRNHRLEELRGTILHLDEVLTMSARMAAATGDLRWEERYQRYEPQLDAAIREAAALAPGQGGELIAQTDAANVKLVEMEHRAFDLVRQGRLEEARGLLFSEEYEDQKEAYAVGLTRLADLLVGAGDSALLWEQRKAFGAVAFVAFAVFALLAGWATVLRTVHSWRAALVAQNRQLADQADDLRRAHDELETRVQERTAELARANEELKRQIADREQAEKELAYERFLLATLMDHSPDYIYFKDTESSFIRISRALAGYFGFKSPEEAIGKSDFDIYDLRRAAQYQADEQQIMRTKGAVIDKEEEQVWPDGRVTWVSTSKVPLLSPGGEVIGTFGISRDITERKRAEIQLQAAKEAAEAANRAKSDFLANMSHEIRTPMNAILGMTELVLDTPLTAAQRDYLTMVRESGESLLAVINDILDFSKIEAGRLDLEHVPFDLRESLGDTMKSLAVRAHAKGLELACRIEPEVPDRLVGDPGRTRQVVVNLVGNAIKFTDAGEVVLSVECRSRADDEALLHFAVADTGIGIPESKRQSIFEAFEQVDSSTTRRFGGTGLGLAISSRLVRAMGGQIWVESEPGRGSTFHFTARFGTAVDEATPVARAWTAAVRDTPVLVVDDNATNRRILEEMLRNWGMRPSLASGAAEALAMMREAFCASQPFTLVLTDAHMPDIDGFTLTERIREDPELGSTVIMMLTSGDRPGDVTRCEQAGVAAYLLKPIKQSELFDAIVMALGVSAPEEQAEVAGTAELRPFPSLRILLAEDSLVNQKLAVGLLEKHGHRVVVANHGREAVAAWQSQPFDLVLMDVQMPEMDGFEATGVIRAKEQRAGGHVPIIAMTAHAMKGDRERCLEAGMDGYIAKPIRAKEVFDTIAGVLGLSPPGDAARPGPQPPATTPEGSIDWSAALAAVRGDPALLRAVVTAVLEEAPRLVGSIRRAITAGDAGALRLAAHTLKGSIRYFGESLPFRRAVRLEEMGRSGNLVEAEQLVGTLEADIAWFIPALAQYVGGSDTAPGS